MRYPSASQKQLMAQCKAPAQFAFCLRPKGLDSSKTQKHRSQRKQIKVGNHLRQEQLHDGTTLDLPDVLHKSSGNGNHVVGSTVDDPNMSSVQVQGPAGFVTAEKAHVGEKRKMKSRGRKAKRTVGETRRKRLRNLQQLDQQMQQESPMEVDLDMLLEREEEVNPSGDHVTALGCPVQSSRRGDGHTSGELEPELDPEAAAESLREAAKEAAEVARALRTRAELMYAQADASMFTAVQLVIEADCMQAAENAANEALQQEWEQEYGYQTECSQEFVGALKYSEGFDAPNLGQGKIAGQEAIKGPSFGSWRKGLENPARTSNSLRQMSTRQSLLNDSDDPLLPVASWSQELGAGLGTRLIAKGDASPLDL